MLIFVASIPGPGSWVSGRRGLNWLEWLDGHNQHEMDGYNNHFAGKLICKHQWQINLLKAISCLINS